MKRLLVADLTAASSHSEELDVEGTLGLGGKVLGIRLLEKYLDPAVDPLSPENVVAITSSLISAYAVYGSNRFAAFTKSPLTGIWL